MATSIKTLSVSDTAIPIPDITPGIQTSEGKLTIAGVTISAVALLFSIINPRFGTHLVLTGTERTVIGALATAAAPTLVAWYSQFRSSLKKHQMSVAADIIQQQIVAKAQTTIAQNQTSASTGGNPGGVVAPVASGSSTAIL